jgi:hypothetical protein
MLRAARQFFANCFLMLSMSLREGGQFASQVLQCKTKASDFNAASNSFRFTVTVKLWLLGQTVSSTALSLMITLVNDFPRPISGSPIFCEHDEVHSHPASAPNRDGEEQIV